MTWASACPSLSPRSIAVTGIWADLRASAERLGDDLCATGLGFVQPISFEPALNYIKTAIWCPWSGKDADGILFLFNDPLEGLCAADCDIDDYAKALSRWKSHGQIRGPDK